MNNNFYAIEVSSAAYDQRCQNQIESIRLAEAIQDDKPAILSWVMRLFSHSL